jgi:DNA polymerase-4
VERLARSVCESLASNQRRGRTVTLKIRLRPFKTYTRSRTLADHTCDPDAVASTARELLERFDPKVPVRLVGVGMAGLAEEGVPHQPDQLAV